MRSEGYIFTLPENISRIEKPAILTFDDGYASVYKNALPFLKSHKIPFIVFPVLEFLGRENRWDAGIGGIYSRHLNEEELKECVKSGAKIGIHGLKHRAFSLMSEAERSVELKRSYKIIKEKFFQDTSCFSPPFGEKFDGKDYFEKISYSFILDNNCWNGETGIVSRFSVYRFETPEMVLKKIKGHPLLRGLSKAVRLGARATVLYQRIKG
jgi:peptidoglycan/xylan/chitin deacetylase (PgdA/CDA1 family)